MSLYAVSFARLGRKQDVPVQTFAADHAEGLAQAMYSFVRQLMSREIDVVCDFRNMSGQVFVGGWRLVGEFTITPLEDLP